MCRAAPACTMTPFPTDRHVPAAEQVSADETAAEAAAGRVLQRKSSGLEARLVATMNPLLPFEGRRT